MAKLVIPFAAALVAASLALPAAAAAGQADLTPLNVTKAPTSLTIVTAGKDKAAVRVEVRTAARTVCRNAIINRELGLDELNWCSDRASDKAMRRFAAIVAKRSFAESGAITLAAR